MSFLTLRENYFSGKVGGGDLGMAIGIVQNTMITDGPIIVLLHLGIEEYLMTGEMITATISGVVVLGIILISAMVILIGIGGDVLAADPDVT